MCQYTKKSQGWIKSAPTPTKLTELSHCSPGSSLRPLPVYTDDLFGLSVHGKGKRNQLSVYKTCTVLQCTQYRRMINNARPRAP